MYLPGKGYPWRLGAVLLAILFGAICVRPQQQQTPLPGSTECVACHDAGRPTGKREAGVPPAFNAAALRASPHAGLECTNCHADLAAKKDFPHAEKLARVDCGSCHSDEQKQYDQSLHGTAAKRGDRTAPSCKTCHGTHAVLRPSNPNSTTSTMGIPQLCGQCHREGSQVSLSHDIPQTNILGNYMDSIHAAGLFQQGLVVTAVCTSCHTAHFVLPHTDPRSSIAKANIAKTCTKCHARIESVHQKVIRGELWEKQPNLIPACVDCHQPHEIRKVFYSQGMADKDCQKCHANPTLKAARGDSMYVNESELAHSRHVRVACVQCHTGVVPSMDRPCKPITAKVDCSVCHAAQVALYNESTHGQLLAKGSPDAPRCLDCHGSHGILGRIESNSPTFSRNVPSLCAKCHRSGQKAALRYTGKQVNIVEHYTESIHGKGLLESGLTVTANCADCHTAHHELPSSDARSSVNRNNIPQTCGQCHRGIFELFNASVHSPKAYPTKKPLPVCSDCHSSHSIERTDLAGFRLRMMDQCGRCHEAITESYFETYHGKVNRLGGMKTAKCSDCHGAHDILPVSDTRSRLSRANIVKTCGQCHAGLQPPLRGLPHARHASRSRQVSVPVLDFLGNDVAAARNADHLGPAHAGLAAALAEVPQGTDGLAPGRRRGLRAPVPALPAQSAPDGDLQLLRPGAHRHDAEVLLRDVGAGNEPCLRRLRGGGPDPSFLRAGDLPLLRAAYLRSGPPEAAGAGTPGSSSSPVPKACSSTATTGGNSSAPSGGS